MDDTNDRSRLRDLLVERSVRLGEFTLSSGARSSWYVDARRTTMSAEGQALTGKVGFELLRGSGLEITHVGGLTMGADPVAYAVAHRSWLEGHPLDGFSVRKKPKEHGTGQRVEGGVPEGARCVVVEDTVTTGGSALDAIAALREHGAAVVAVLTLVDRQEGGRERIEAEGLPVLSAFTGEELVAAAKAAGATLLVVAKAVSYKQFQDFGIRVEADLLSVGDGEEVWSDRGRGTSANRSWEAAKKRAVIDLIRKLPAGEGG